MATKQIVPLNPKKILHLYNSENVEYYVGLGYILPMNQNIYGLCSPYILLQKYYIANTLKTQGLSGDWFDDNGNKYTFSSSGVVITTPSGTTKTIELPNPDSDKTAILYFTYSEVDGLFSIVVGKNAVPYDYSSQYGTYQTAQRTANDYNYAYELCDTISATNRDTYGWGTVLIVPDYNNITPNAPVRSAMCLWTNKGNYSVLQDYESFRVDSLTNINFKGFVSPLVDNPEDPYDEGGSTSTGGGSGTFDPSGDTIGVPNLPTISAIDTGFVSIWRPTKAQLKSLYNYLWSGLDLNTFKKIFANPIDTIMGFSIIPLSPTTGTAKELKVGNIGTGITVTPVTEQYYEIDCGTITIPEFFGSYLDYEPYTTIDLYLPYIGSVRISTDDIKRNPPNNGTIQLIYHIDILSGSCVVFVVTNGTVSYQYNGSILTQLPITGNDFTSTINSVLGLTSNIVGGVMSASTGNAAGVLGNSVNAAHNVTSAKPSINRSGNISGSGGFLGIQKPFLIMNLPKQAIAFAQNTFTGYPAHITNSVKSLSGYTEFEQIWIEKVPATENELSEIESILTSGVIL